MTRTSRRAPAPGAMGIPGEGFNRALGRWEVYVPGARQKLRYRYIMEQHVGRALRSDEQVHHINGDPTDDRLENLQVVTQAEHSRLHCAYGWSKRAPACITCGTTERKHLARGMCQACYLRAWRAAA